MISTVNCAQHESDGGNCNGRISLVNLSQNIWAPLCRSHTGSRKFDREKSWYAPCPCHGKPHKKEMKKSKPTKSEHKTKEICKYFVRGRCDRGDECKFAHVKPVTKAVVPVSKKTESKAPVCKYFARGHCARGDECKFAHVQETVSVKEHETASKCGSGKQREVIVTRSWEAPYSGPQVGDPFFSLWGESFVA